MKTLFLGKKESAFYKSLKTVIPHFNVKGFLDEHSLNKAAEVVSHFNEGRYTHVLMPNPYGNNRRYNCYLQLKKKNITVIASDRGALPDSWFFDSGFNADSKSFDPASWDFPLKSHEEEKVRQYISYLTTSSETLEKNGDRVGKDRLRESLGIAEDKIIVFVPLQRPNDTVMKYFSEPVKSLENFIGWLVKAEKALNADQNKYVFILKKHPLESSYPTISCDSKNIGFVPDQVNFNDLVDLCDIVALVNSGVGLISLAYNKPVVCAGNAFYAHPGLARQVANYDNFVQELASPIRPKDETILRFYHHLLTSVYSFGKFITERVKDGNSYRSITRKIDFYDLRILGETIFSNRPILEEPKESVSSPLPIKKVLFVIPLAPIPIYRGNQARIEVVVKQTIENPNCEVHLCVLNRSFGKKKSKDYANEIKSHFKGVKSVTVLKGLEFPGRSKLLHVESYVAKKHKTMLAQSHITNYFDCPVKFRRAVANLIYEKNIDEVIVNYAAQMEVVPKNFSGKVILDTHDYQYNHVKSDQEENGVKKNVDLEKFRRSEIAAIKKADVVVAINPKEKVLMEEFCTDNKVVCLPQFFPSYYKKQPNFWIKSYSAVFVGSAANFNVSGLIWFMDYVLPEIITSLPDFKLAVVGDVCRLKDIKEKAGKFPDNVSCLGRVDSLEAIYAQSTCVIAPILGGAGMKIKVIEALAYGKCVIGTTQACDGIVETSKASIIVKDTPKEFALAVRDVCSNAEKRRLMEQEGVKHFEETYSVDAQIPNMKSIFQTL